MTFDELSDLWLHGLRLSVLNKETTYFTYLLTSAIGYRIPVISHILRNSWSEILETCHIGCLLVMCLCGFLMCRLFTVIRVGIFISCSWPMQRPMRWEIIISSRLIGSIRYDTIAEFNVDSKAELNLAHETKTKNTSAHLFIDEWWMPNYYDDELCFVFFTFAVIENRIVNLCSAKSCVHLYCATIHLKFAAGLSSWLSSVS